MSFNFLVVEADYECPVCHESLDTFQRLHEHVKIHFPLLPADKLETQGSMVREVVPLYRSKLFYCNTFKPLIPALVFEGSKTENQIVSIKWIDENQRNCKLVDKLAFVGGESNSNSQTANLTMATSSATTEWSKNSKEVQTDAIVFVDHVPKKKIHFENEEKENCQKQMPKNNDDLKYSVISVQENMEITKSDVESMEIKTRTRSGKKPILANNMANNNELKFSVVNVNESIQITKPNVVEDTKMRNSKTQILKSNVNNNDNLKYSLVNVSENMQITKADVEDEKIKIKNRRGRKPISTYNVSKDETKRFVFNSLVWGKRLEKSNVFWPAVVLDATGWPLPEKFGFVWLFWLGSFSHDSKQNFITSMPRSDVYDFSEHVEQFYDENYTERSYMIGVQLAEKIRAENNANMSNTPDIVTKDQWNRLLMPKSKCQKALLIGEIAENQENLHKREIKEELMRYLE